jgi:hypothetical protein
VIARAKALEKDQFYFYLTDVLLKKCPPPREFGGEAVVRSVIEVMFSDYYRYGVAGEWLLGGAHGLFSVSINSALTSCDMK